MANQHGRSKPAQTLDASGVFQDMAPDPMFAHDAEYRLLRFNEAYRQAAGVEYHEAFGQPYWQIFPKIGGPLPGCTRTGEQTQEGDQGEVEVSEGRYYRVEGFPVHDAQGRYLYSVHVLHRTTEGFQAGNGELGSGQPLEQAGPGLLLADGDGYVRCVNGAFEDVFGYDRYEIRGRHIGSLGVADQPEAFSPDAVAAWVREHDTWHGPVQRRARDNTPISVYLAVAAIRDVEGHSLLGYLATYLDLRIVEAARRRTFALRSVIEDLSSEIDIDALGTKAVTAAVRLTRADIGTVPLLEPGGETLHHRWHVGLPRSDRGAVMRGFGRDEGLTSEVLATGRTQVITDYANYARALPEYVALGIKSVLLAPVYRGDDLVGALGVTKRGASGFAREDVACVEAIARQIGVALQREALFNELRTSEARYRRVVETVPDILYEADPSNLHTLYVSPAVESLLGYTAEELVAQPGLWAECIHPDDRDAVLAALTRVLEAGEQRMASQYRMRTRANQIRWFEDRVRIDYDANGTPVSIFGVMDDITGRKQAERAYKTLSAANQSLVRAKDEHELLSDACRAIVEEGGYVLAWVGYAEAPPGRQVRPVAHCGRDEGYVDSLDITWADTERGQGPTGTAIRTGQTTGTHDIEHAPAFDPWRDAAQARGFASSLAVPLADADGNAFGALNIYAAEPNAFDTEERTLLEELASDLAYGIDALRNRAHAEAAEADYREALRETVRAVARMVEYRDPYTAGHQERVADLATAIAHKLGLDEERIEGIRMAGWLHDIGKIVVPAEILARPGGLRETEFDLIQRHPEVGYDIIRDVHFPWPVKEIVLQHHERLDGSGYPKGLSGDQIRLESRILAVADVVEAMASHRPYRPAFRLDAALDHVSAGSNVQYDADVVDACVRLFREDGYQPTPAYNPPE